MHLDDFKNIFEINGATIFNLQYGDIKKELSSFLKKQNYEIISLRKLDIFNNFIGLANLLTELDIFVTVSNSTAHLAGALGVKTLLIKPKNHALFHYWNQSSNKTPWYNSITLIDKKEIDSGKDLLDKYLNF